MTRPSCVVGALRAIVLHTILGATLLAALSVGAHAEEFSVGGRSYPSLEAFLQGSWTWLRRDPPQIVHMRYGKDGSFYFNNETIRLTHNGTYKGTPKGIELVITQTCDAKGCADRAPPMVVNYPLRPEAPNRFYSADEEWNRDP